MKKTNHKKLKNIYSEKLLTRTFNEKRDGQEARLPSLICK